MTNYPPLAERRLRDKALHAFVRTRTGRRLFTGPAVPRSIPVKVLEAARLSA
ncbi:hypothetical protein [Mycolicibacterium sp. CH28]|uniref:hypothetical protein n=1 Tax=Mycolicibacterium sp. CH28 TaxID=2512237 RepID=UPI0013873F33|nr:hypothetical protein [Mycolicibacterium sp. CH28]